MAEILTSPSSTNPTSPASATSTTGTGRRPSSPVRLAVKRKPLAETLTAYQIQQPTEFTLGDGQIVKGWPPNYVISRGETVIDLCSPRDFQLRYELADRRTLVLDDSDRTSIERTLGIGSTETRQHLTTAIARLASLRIGAITIDFTPGQWETLAHRAEKRGISVEALVRQIVDRITGQIWAGEA